ncbi:MAG: hypothetical protein IJK44_07060 [Bacteroidales bacterium]|nr:hypothetical protein [Bacteroidales bacterium]
MAWMHLLPEAQEKNFQRCPIIGQHVWPNANVAKTYAGEVFYLWSFYYTRVRWMDSQIQTW